MFGLAQRPLGQACRMLTPCKGERPCLELTRMKTETKKVKDQDEQKWASCRLLREARSLTRVFL